MPKFTKYIALPAFALALFFISGQLALADSWATKATGPVSGNAISGSLVNGIVYVLMNASAGNSLLAYNVAGNSWSTIGSVPSGVQGGYTATAGYNNLFYVFGAGSGCGSYTASYYYNPSNPSWNSIAAMPNTVCESESTAVVINGIIYVIGGYNGSGVSNVTQSYNPVTNSWATLATMPTARYGLTTNVVNGIIYASGGSTSANEAYNPSTNSWSSQASPPSGTTWVGGATLSNIIYLFAGSGGGTANQIYNPTANSWSTGTAVPESGWWDFGIPSGSNIYVFFPNGHTYMYTPSPVVTPPTASNVSASASGNSPVVSTANATAGTYAISSYQWYSNNNCSTAINGATASTYSTTLGIGSYTYSYKAIDSQGNASNCATDAITVYSIYSPSAGNKAEKGFLMAD